MARISLIILSVCLTAAPVHLIVPPKTPVLSGFEPAAIGTYRELVCDASQPDAGSIFYKWYKYSLTDNQGNTWESKPPIGTSQKYIFNPVSEKQVFHQGGNPETVGGKYICRASNSAGTRDSDWGDLYVYIPCSQYTVSASPAKPVIGSTFTVNCYIPNPSGLSVMWAKEAEYSSLVHNTAFANNKGCHVPTNTRYSWSICGPPSTSSKTKTFSLKVTNAQTSDSTYWTCKDIGLSCISDPVKIVAQAQPGTPQIRGFLTGPVATGAPVNLVCVASPPGDAYDWYKDSTRLTNSLTYNFQAKKESAGVYKCVARNTAGSATSLDKTLIVYYKSDSVVVSSGKTSCHAGETDGFKCTATGGSPTPTLKIFIKRSGQTPVEVTQGQDRVMVKEDNQAEYYCEAKVAGYPSIEVTTVRKTYIVTFPNTKVLFAFDATRDVQVGQVKRFRCATDASNPVTSINWFQSVGGSWQDVTSGITSSESNTSYGAKRMISEWSVTATKAMNCRTVRCSSSYSLTGHGFSTFADTVMLVKWSATELKMVEKPNSPITAGTSVNIKCETDSSNSRYLTAISWYRNGLRIMTGVTPSSRSATFGGIIYISQLTVTARKEDNQAKYECKIYDQANFKKDVIITVHYPPTVKLSSNPKTMKEGDNLILTCGASGGNPASYTYSWYYNNLKRSETSKEYNITGIKYTQSGKYKCETINYSPGGKAEDITEIDVLYKAKWNPSLPEIFTVASKTNEPVKFVLHVIAYPPPAHISWFFQNGTKIGKSFTALKVNDKTYTLNKTSVTIKDYGNYTVIVTNQVGVSAFVFELQRTSPPYPPCCLKMTNKTAVSVYLTFKSNFSGGSAQTFTIEQSPEGNRRKRSEWVKAAERISDPGFEKDVFHKVKGLTSGTKYQFRVKAVNADGSSGYNDPGNGNFLKVTTKAAPVADLVVTRKDDSVTFSWSLERKYSKIQIKYCQVKGGPCLYRDVESPAKQGSTKLDVNKEQAYKYSLVVFDIDDKVFVSAHKVPLKHAQPTNYGVIGGAAAGGVLLILVIVAVILAVVFIKKRRAERGEDKHTTVTFDNTSGDGLDGGPDSGPVYMNIDNNGFRGEVENVEPVYSKETHAVGDNVEPVYSKETHAVGAVENVEPVYSKETHAVVNHHREAESEYEELQHEQRVPDIVYEDLRPRPSAQNIIDDGGASNDMENPYLLLC